VTLPSDDVETLELARSELAQRLTRQNEEIKALDTKSQVLLGFAVTALTVIFTAPMPAAARYVSGLIFLPVFAFGGMALAIWKYQDPIVPDELVQLHLSSGQQGLLLVLVASYRSAVNANRVVLQERLKHWQAGLGCMAVAVAVGAIGLLIGE
jgi:hypothetical protein